MKKKSAFLECDLIIKEISILLKAVSIFKRRAKALRAIAHSRACAIKKLLRETPPQERRYLEGALNRKAIGAQSIACQKFWNRISGEKKAVRGRPRKEA